MNHSILIITLGIGMFFSPALTSNENIREKPVTISHINGQDLSEKLQGAVQNRLLSPLRKKDHHTQRMFSRCPTGYDMQFANVNYANGKEEIQAAKDGLYYGQIDYYSSCDGNKVCDFRVNSETLTVEARFGLKDDYIPAKQWLELFDNDKGSTM